MSAPYTAHSCGIVAFGAVHSTPAELAELRKNPGSYGPNPIGPLVKVVDDQAVLAVAAVLKAIRIAGWQERSFADWGTIAAPRFLGRSRAAATIAKYKQVGVRGVSPMVIPTTSLHALSGSMSIVLKCHGPNFSIGGGPGHIAEAISLGMNLVMQMDLPGLWVAITEFNPEPTLDVAGQPIGDWAGQGLALALTRDTSEAGFAVVRRPLKASIGEYPRLTELSAFLSGESVGPAWFSPSGDAILEIVRQRSAALPGREAKAG